MSITLQIGQRVEVTGKNVQGEVAYVGSTMFASGKWIGIILDEPKGKNNGTIQGKAYFHCKDNYGMFVRQSQLTLLTDTGSRIDLSTSTSSLDESIKTPKTRLTSIRRKSSPASQPTPKISSRLSLGGRTTKETRSREDMSASTSSLTEPPNPKRASFIEGDQPMAKTVDSSVRSQTGFVETLKPQFTPGQVVSPGPTVSTPQPVKLQLEPSPEVEQLKEQIKELSEKLETMRIKYKEKSHELDSLNIQLEQSAEFKNKIMESQAGLKRELERAKRERQEALDAKDELSEMADTLEMATLDKEMAEEKAESLQKELEQAMERIEELEMELEIVKAELSDKMEAAGITVDEDEATPFKMKQLLQQNEKLKDTLVRLRDLSAHEKHEKQKLLKDFEEKQSDFDQLLKCDEKLKSRIAEMEEQIDELHAQVDAALGAEEMVETLGQQKLSLEEKVKELEETVAELEELQEVNDQLQEGFKEQEQDFRQELDLKNLQIWEAQRKTEQLLESLADRELTIVKFRELVGRIQEENQDLRLQVDSSSKASPMPSEIYDFKKMFAETKAHARAIDLELRHMEVHQAQQHVQYLVNFMPDFFLTRGGDNDAVMLVLLMPRLLAKCQVLISQLRDKFPAASTVDKTTVVKAQQFSAMSRFSTHIYILMGVLHQFVHGLNTCKPETLLKAGSSYLDMVQQEKALDAYIELLKQDKVDENVNTESLERIVTYFSTLHNTLILQSGDTGIHQGQLLADTGKAILCAIDSINTDINIILTLTQSEGLEVLKKTPSWFEGLRSQLRQVRRHSDVGDLHLSQGSDLSGVSPHVVTLARVIAETATGLALTTNDTDSLLPTSKFQEVLRQSFDKHVDSEKYKSDTSYIEQSMESIAIHVSNLVKALQDNEDKYLAQQKEKETVEAPLMVRAKAVKAKLNAMSGVEKRLERSAEDMREMRMALRAKQEELAEMSLRKDISEKKLANITRDYELTIETLKRKLEESHQQLKRKEKEFEETMDHLQKDIDSLEMEKGELKDKLKTLPKKAIMDMKASPMTLISNEGGLSNMKVIESPILLNEIDLLKSELRHEKRLRTKAQYRHYMDVLKKLPPIHVKSKSNVENEDIKRIEELQKKVLRFQQDFINSLPTVINFSKIKPGVDKKDYMQKYLIEEEIKEKKMRDSLNKLQMEVTNEIIRQRKGAHIKTDLALFASPEMVKAAQETDFVPMCEIVMKTADPDLMGKTISLNVDLSTLEVIKKKLFALS
ncbi:dynactin subunit 1 isoform X4 [Halyomorpha halys]|uniref:dynactin subunit 1 isoform X4 n=1 Tax=Halyomorpha halys TaxID=286706 RepID=UPI0006D52198|nr:dynactin subunit 1 isoform X4 [Halyomorpha halys]